MWLYALSYPGVAHLFLLWVEIIPRSFPVSVYYRRTNFSLLPLLCFHFLLLLPSHHLPSGARHSRIQFWMLLFFSFLPIWSSITTRPQHFLIFFLMRPFERMPFSINKSCFHWIIYKFKLNRGFYIHSFVRTSLHLALSLTWANLSPRVGPIFTTAEGIPNSEARRMNRKPEYTCSEEPRTRRQSLDANWENTNSTRGFGTLSPKKTISGLKNPRSLLSQWRQCGTRKVLIISLK